jgi:hypothetical protein
MSLYSTKLDQLYSFIPEKIILSRNLKNRFLNRLCRFIARKICLYRKNVTKLDQLYRFIPGKIILSRNLAGNFGRQLWPATLAGNFGR